MGNEEDWERAPSMEDVDVYRWYDGPGGAIASVVKGYFPGEANLRISGGTLKHPIEIRGHKAAWERMSDADVIRHIKKHIKQEVEGIAGNKKGTKKQEYSRA
jgi:hypothetical protein